MPNTPKSQEPSAKSLFNELEWRLINLNGCNLTADETLRRLLESPAALDALGLERSDKSAKSLLEERYSTLADKYSLLADKYAALAASHGELLDKLQKIEKIAWGYDGDCEESAIIGDLSTAESLQSRLPLKGAE